MVSDTANFLSSNTKIAFFQALVALQQSFVGKFTKTAWLAVQSNLVNMNLTGPSKKVHIKRNFTLTVARCMGVIIPGDFKVVRIKRYFALNVFVLTRFHCIGCLFAKGAYTEEAVLRNV